jgi:hypothetical protein
MSGRNFNFTPTDRMIVQMMTAKEDVQFSMGQNHISTCYPSWFTKFRLSCRCSNEKALKKTSIGFSCPRTRDLLFNMGFKPWCHLLFPTIHEAQPLLEVKQWERYSQKYIMDLAGLKLGTFFIEKYHNP